jgi:hypothetical protein
VQADEDAPRATPGRAPSKGWLASRVPSAPECLKRGKGEGKARRWRRRLREGGRISWWPPKPGPRRRSVREGDVVVARFRGPCPTAYLNEAAVCICARPGTMRHLNRKKGNRREGLKEWREDGPMSEVGWVGGGSGSPAVLHGAVGSLQVGHVARRAHVEVPMQECRGSRFDLGC